MELDIFRSVIPPVEGKVNSAALMAKLAVQPPTERTVEEDAFNC